MMDTLNKGDYAGCTYDLSNGGSVTVMGYIVRMNRSLTHLAAEMSEHGEARSVWIVPTDRIFALTSPPPPPSED